MKTLLRRLWWWLNKEDYYLMYPRRKNTMVYEPTLKKKICYAHYWGKEGNPCPDCEAIVEILKK